MAGYVLDTSALMALVYDKEGAGQVRDIIRSAERVSVPFLAWREVQYKLLRDRPDVLDEAFAMILDWPVETVESDPRWREAAAMVKARGRLSLADAWIASLALLEDAALVHKDPEFDTVPGLQHARLPYRGARG